MAPKNPASSRKSTVGYGDHPRICNAKCFYPGGLSPLLVYDITRKSSFDNLEMWLETITENAREDIVILLIGNKIDLVDEREVTTN